MLKSVPCSLRIDTQTDTHKSDYCGHPFRVSGVFPSTYHQGLAQLRICNNCKSFTMKNRLCNNQPTLMKIIPNDSLPSGPHKIPSHAPLALIVQPDSLVLSWWSVELLSGITDYSPVTYRIEVRYWN